ncbi:MAG: LPS export ABC transporter periplasmic protein LptC [Candidatus Eiseniibacteriota bacterium]
MTRDLRRGRRDSSALLALAVVLAIWFAAGCGGEDRVVPQPRSQDLPTQEVRDFSLAESNEGRPEWILTSRYAATYQQRGVIVARDVAIDFFDSEGKKYSHLTAREGEVKQPSNDMEARGNVVVTTEDGVRIETSSLSFLNRERKIVSNEFVRLERNGDVVTGVGFESDPSLEHFSIKRQVRAQVQTSPGGGLRFRERDRP